MVDKGVQNLEEKKRVNKIKRLEKPIGKPVGGKAASVKTADKALKKIRISLDREEIAKLSAVSVNVPNFLIIGAQKGGTTWLHANLKKHPEILLPPGKKELEFFSYNQSLSFSNLTDYLGHFNKLNGIIQRSRVPKAVGEATPSYFWSVDVTRDWCNPPNGFNPNIPASVLQMLGKDVKLILCLRDPVSRAISAYLHHVRFSRIDYKKQRIMAVGKQYGIIDMGFYHRHLSDWLNYFDLSNFKILIYERDIKKNKEKTIGELCDFLRVDPSLFPPSNSINEYHNKGLSYKRTEEGVFIQEESSAEMNQVITREEIDSIYKIYEEDIKKMETLLQISLSDWRR